MTCRSPVCVLFLCLLLASCGKEIVVHTEPIDTLVGKYKGVSERNGYNAPWSILFDDTITIIKFHPDSISIEWPWNQFKNRVFKYDPSNIYPYPANDSLYQWTVQIDTATGRMELDERETIPGDSTSFQQQVFYVFRGNKL